MKTITNTMCSKAMFILLLAGTLSTINSSAQEKPFVYDMENTGANFAKPAFPALSDMPVVNPLTDPFEWSDGSARDTTFASWSHRRSEIKAEIENYEIGWKPERPDTITASYSKSKKELTVKVTKNGQTLTLVSTITLPEGDGPFPAVIGMNSGTGSLPSDIFTSRKIATIPFIHNQVTIYNTPSNTDPFFKLYPDHNIDNTGQYCAWSWGISRLIDGLELVQDSLPIDLKHLAVTGCSYAGKMALFAGAFDERIALTIAQESGGGGAAAWRVSETIGNVENLGATSRVWFRKDMFNFTGKNVAKLPHDHHELMAMVAPRALFLLGNPDYVWLADESGYVSCRAAHEVWKNFGIADRFGFSIVGNHGHCMLPDSERPEIEAFVDKFMLGDSTVNTNITTNPYPSVNYSRWIEWWGKGKSYFPEQFYGETVMMEAECGNLGGDWAKGTDSTASNNAYVVSHADKAILKKDLITEASLLQIPFSVDSTATFSVAVRLNCPSPDFDSFWIKMDNGTYSQKMNMGTAGWEWKNFGDYKLEKGNHIVTIAYREPGAQIDKVSVSSYLYYLPTGIGDEAQNVCDPRVGMNFNRAIDGFKLENHPNPFNGNTTVTFEIPTESFVSVKVYNVLGVEIAELAGKEYSVGRYTVDFDAKGLSDGMYFCTMKTNNCTMSKKMIIKVD